MTQKTLSDLRSQKWFAADSMRAFAHRQRAQQMGLAREQFMGKPIIAVINTWSDLSPCHAHLRERAEHIKHGIIAAGGHPFELPALSLGEVMVKPTTMLYRNFLAMECEELLRSLPIDGAVLMGGCDKTTPGLLMGAISVDLPIIFCPAGPMLNDRLRGQTVGAGTHTKIFWDDYQAGKIDQTEWIGLESRMTRSPGTCNTMGTASTMTLIIEAMGLTLSGAASIPAMDAAHARMAWQCGHESVGLVWRDRRPSEYLTKAAFHNGLVTWMAAGGSTNAAIHLMALAKRAGVALTLDEMDELARQIPLLVNIFPCGKYLMEDFYYAGGLPALLSRLADKLDLKAENALGLKMAALLNGAKILDEDVIRPLDHPVSKLPTLAVLRGNLCPDGAVIKPFAASEKFLHHTGRAVVFDSNEEMLAKINDPALNITENDILVLRNAGPIGAPGMPEWGALPIPKKLLQQGVRDMLRISDARMSGTHFGSCILHVAPESAVGGALALVQTGDQIEFNYTNRSLKLLISEQELSERRKNWQPPRQNYPRGYTKIYLSEVEQANLGADFKSLTGSEPTPEPPIY
ncbi:MAG: dihydroxy-acid dehydratase [Alphaproteobacteria bacterium]|nr:dihydroxy-acid dehydratase [Alphaproteobacteria bacterium]